MRQTSAGKTGDLSPDVVEKNTSDSEDCRERPEQWVAWSTGANLPVEREAAGESATGCRSFREAY